MTNAEIKAFYDTYIDGKTADELAEEIFRIAGQEYSGVAITYNNADYGFDVKDHILKLMLLYWAFFSAVDNDASALKGAAEVLTRLDSTAFTKEPKIFHAVFTPRIVDGKYKYYLADCDQDNTIYYCARSATTGVYYGDMPGDETKGLMLQVKSTSTQSNRWQFFYGTDTGCVSARERHSTTTVDYDDWRRINTTGEEFKAFAAPVLERLTAAEAQGQYAQNMALAMHGPVLPLAWERKTYKSTTGVEANNTRALSGFAPYNEQDNICVWLTNNHVKPRPAGPRYMQLGIVFYGALGQEAPTVPIDIADEQALNVKVISATNCIYTSVFLNDIAPEGAAWFRVHIMMRGSYPYIDSAERDELMRYIYATNDAGTPYEEIYTSSNESDGSQTDIILDEKNIVLTDDGYIEAEVRKDARNVLITTRTKYAMAAGMEFTPANTELYASAYASDAESVLNPATLSKKNVTYSTTPQTCYLTTGTELNGRYEISYTDGGEAQGWIDACHVPRPKIQPVYYNPNDANEPNKMRGTRFVVGVGGGYGYRNQFRLPPCPYNATRLRLYFTVPNGCTLTIEAVEAIYSDEVNRYNKGYEIDSHGSFYQMAAHTRQALEAAAACGATRFITIPKWSSDNVWFAYHDDALYLTAPEQGDKFERTKLHTADGKHAIELPDISAYDKKRFYDIPYGLLAQLSAGHAYIGQRGLAIRLMRIDEMFDVCARTGMKPMFSMHPYEASKLYSHYLSAEDSLKKLARRYNVLHRLTLKFADFEHFSECAYQIFGLDVEKYAVTISSGEADTTLPKVIDMFKSACNPVTMNTAQAPSAANRFYRDSSTGKIHYYRSLGSDSGEWVKTANSNDKAEYPLLPRSMVMIELFAPDVSRARIQDITNAGFQAGVASVEHLGADGTYHEFIDSDDYEMYINYGATEFTDNKFASWGLAW